MRTHRHRFTTAARPRAKTQIVVLLRALAPLLYTVFLIWGIMWERLMSLGVFVCSMAQHTDATTKFGSYHTDNDFNTFFSEHNGEDIILRYNSSFGGDVEFEATIDLVLRSHAHIDIGDGDYRFIHAGGIVKADSTGNPRKVGNDWEVETVEVEEEPEPVTDGGEEGAEESECVECGAVEEPEHGIEIKLVGELNEPVCTVCIENHGDMVTDGGMYSDSDAFERLKTMVSRSEVKIQDEFFNAMGYINECDDDHIKIRWVEGPNRGVEFYHPTDIVEDIDSRYEIIKDDRADWLMCDGGTDIDNSDMRVVIPEHIVTKETDRRGRFSLGNQYGNKRVTVAVVNTEDTDE